MPFVLPLVSIALAVLAQFAFRDAESLPWRWHPERVVALLAIGGVAIWLALHHGTKADSPGLVPGLLLGFAITSILAGRPVSDHPAAFVVSLAAGVVGGSAIHLLAPAVQAAGQLGLMGGAALGALVLGGESGAVAALGAVVVAAADYLSAKHTGSPSGPILGSIIGLCAVVGGILAGLLKGRLRFAQGLTVAAAEIVGLLTLSEWYLSEAALIGVGAGWAIDWLVADDDSDGVRIALAAVIGIGVATVAFGLTRGAGMAVALTSAAGLLVATRNRAGLLTLGPLLGLVLFRVLGEAHPSASHALDIGQHYALLGLTLGAIVPLLPTDWFRGPEMPETMAVQRATNPNPSPPRAGSISMQTGGAGPAEIGQVDLSPSVAAAMRGIAAALWGALALGLPPLVVLMFGEKGAIGFVVGLGFSGVCQALRTRRDLLPLALAGGMASVTMVSLNAMAGVADMSRADKVREFEMASVTLVAVAGLLVLVSPGRRREVAK